MATYNERLAVALQFSPIEDALAGALAWDGKFSYRTVREQFRSAISEIASYPIHGQDREEYKEHDPLEEWEAVLYLNRNSEDRKAVPNHELTMRIKNAVETITANFD